MLRSAFSRFSQIRIDRLQAVAFVTGFALMAYELVASRLLAPSIGSSIYVWTSVIGVIIAALSVGFMVGGYLADRRTQSLDIVWLLIVCSLFIILTLPMSDILLEPVGDAISDQRLRGLVVSLFLFAPTSFIFGVISPYLARLRNHSLKTTGRAVAGLSSLNALGGIAGTFITGYILFSIIGSKQIVAIVALIILACSWLIAPRERLNRRIPFTIALVLTCITYAFSGVSAATVIDEIDTPTARYQIIQDSFFGRPARFVGSGPQGYQSGMYLDQPDELVFPYTAAMAKLIEKKSDTSSVLFLGGGAFSLPRYIASNHANIQSDVVEIDPELVNISMEYFNLKPLANLHIFTEDARIYLNNTNKRYDVIVVDVYHDITVPFALTTTEYTKKLADALNPNGIVLVNMIGASTEACKPYFDQLQRSYLSAFQDYRIYPMLSLQLNSFQNMVMAYGSKQAMSQLPIESTANYKPAAGNNFTDNFAPAESLWQRCLSAED